MKGGHPHGGRVRLLLQHHEDFGFITRFFQLHIKLDASARQFQDVFQLRQFKAQPRRRVAKLAKRVLADGQTAKPFVVMDYKEAIEGAANVELDHVAADVNRTPKSRQRILVRAGRYSPAMRYYQFGGCFRASHRKLRGRRNRLPHMFHQMPGLKQALRLVQHEQEHPGAARSQHALPAIQQEGLRRMRCPADLRMPPAVESRPLLPLLSCRQTILPVL